MWTTDAATQGSPPTGAATVVGAPVPLSSLIGRVEEAAELAGLLARTRLVTVTGAGGGGKTRVALAVARRWATGHPQARVCWVDLSAVDAAELVGDQVAAAVAANGTTPAELAVALPGSTDLVVLDNCEHLLDAVAELTEAWLAACPGVRVLATSRSPLRVSAERRWPLPPMRTPPVDEDCDLLTYDAVRLFVDRAQAVRPDLHIGPDDALVLGEICRRLDGNPLAIELCAARTHVLGLAHLSAALDDAERLLAGRSRSAPGRHRTLWRTLDWSHRLLEPDEAELFATLGVFAGPADLEAVRALAGRDSLDALTSLVEHSLVRPTTDPANADQRRFELADPIRQYARRRLEQSGRGPDLRDRHLQWYAAQAAQAAAHRGGAEQSPWFARMRADLAELRAALVWARTSGNTMTQLRLAADLAPFATTSGLHREGRAWLEQALSGGDATGGEQPRARDDAALVAHARQAAGKLAFLQCDYAGATARLRQAEEGFERLGDERGRAMCSAALAAVALTGTTSAAAGPAPAAPAPTPAAAPAAAPLPAPVIKWSKRHGHKVATFDMVRSTASVAKNCLQSAKATVSIEQAEEVEIMRVYASGLPKDTDFDFFVLQQPDAPFGMSWYQGDLESNKHGRAYVKFIGRFNEETFTVAPGVLPAPVTHDEQPFPDADKNPATAPVHQYHLGFWFNSPKDAAKAGCLDATTPFNGEHNAGVQAMSTRQFPTLAGPLSRIRP